MKAWLWKHGDPKLVAKYIPVSWVPMIVRIGAYLQAIGRESYHQCEACHKETIDGKLEQAYGPHET